MPDPRFERTQRQLHEAIIALVLAQPYDSITTRQIVARAGVGYATFYRHYADKEALLLAVLDQMLGELKGLLPSGGDDWTAEGELIFRHAAENRALYRVLLQGEGTQTVFNHVLAGGVAELLPRLAHRVGETAVPLPVVAHHMVTSIMSLIKWWLENNMPYPPSQMGEIYASLIFRPFLARQD
jgi:AcrR family transcriptional regulator